MKSDLAENLLNSTVEESLKQFKIAWVEREVVSSTK